MSIPKTPPKTDKNTPTMQEMEENRVDMIELIRAYVGILLLTILLMFGVVR